MSKYLEILADVKTKLEAIPDVGKVHDYFRWNKDPSAFIQQFAFTPQGGSKQVRGWEITRTAAPEHQRGAFFRHHRFRINGYLSLKDADETDKTFQVLVDDVCEAFRNADGPPAVTWHYGDGDNSDEAPAQAGVIDVRAFGTVLCHHAEIVLNVTERIIG